jgi:hypothetical protein
MYHNANLQKGSNVINGLEWMELAANFARQVQGVDKLLCDNVGKLDLPLELPKE